MMNALILKLNQLSEKLGTDQITAQGLFAQELDECITALQASLMLQVDIRTEFGIRRVYPSCELAQDVAALLRCKTFSRAQIQGLRKLGYEFIVNNPHSDLLGEV